MEIARLMSRFVPDPSVKPYRIPRCRRCSVELERPKGAADAMYLPTICADCGAIEHDARLATTVGASTERLPSRYRTIRFTSGELVAHAPVAAIQAADRALAALLDRKALTVVLRGASGVGKTCIAAAMANAVIDAAKPGVARHVLQRAAGVRWESAHVIGRDPKTSDFETTAKRERAIRDATEASFLVLDELGREESKDAIFALLNTRHEWSRPTVVTTWLPKKSADEASILTRYDGGTSRRLLEPPHAVLVDVERTKGAA